MGQGKTQSMIQKMNDDKNTEYNYFYITPYLKEVDRIQKSCDRKFYQPDSQRGHGSKLTDLHNLLAENKDIVSTHSLFRMATDETRELIKSGKYILILDEVMDVVEYLELSKSDLDTLINTNLITIENNTIKWNEKSELGLDYEGRFSDIKNMAMNNCLFIVDGKILVWTFPISIFEYFEEVYVLTYLFNGQIQKYYYDLYNIEYEYYRVFKDEDKYYISQDDKNYKEIKDRLKEKIHIIDDKINNIGDEDYSLSATWYKKNNNRMLMNKLKNNIYNFYHNKYNTKSNEIIWTTYKHYKTKLQGKGYAKRFIPLNARATNEYKDCKYLSYCCNIFVNPIYHKFFYQYDIKIDQDIYALSEMIQWIWRGAIREENDIWLFLPSKRMRNLLEYWLEN